MEAQLPLLSVTPREPSEKRDDFCVYTHSEGPTGTNQLVRFSCHPSKVEAVKDFLRQHIRSIFLPQTGRTHISHGGFGKDTRYDIVQRKYAGSRMGYMEVLEIKDAPDGRCGFVIYRYDGHDRSFFVEWGTVAQAEEAFEQGRAMSETECDALFPKLPGFKRRVECGALTPWFYAIGDERLVGDYTFPDGLQDDPVYRFGRKFVVRDGRGETSIKTCMGSRFFDKKERSFPFESVRRRTVYWSDGTTLEENASLVPRPLEDDEAWIAEAMHLFQQLLAGRTARFEIKLTDGNIFVGCLKQKDRFPDTEGDYEVSAVVEEQETPVRGWIRDFRPTKEEPHVMLYIKRRLKERGFTAVRVEILNSPLRQGKRKWAGVFFAPSADASKPSGS